MKVTKPEDMFSPKLPNMNLWTVAPAWVFEEKRLKAKFTTGDISKYLGEYIHVENYILHSVAKMAGCSPAEVSCYYHEGLGKEVLLVKGVCAGYLEDWET